MLEKVLDWTPSHIPWMIMYIKDIIVICRVGIKKFEALSHFYSTAACLCRRVRYSKFSVFDTCRHDVGWINLWSALLRQNWRSPEGEPTVLFPDSYAGNWRGRHSEYPDENLCRSCRVHGCVWRVWRLFCCFSGCSLCGYRWCGQSGCWNWSSVLFHGHHVDRWTASCR